MQIPFQITAFLGGTGLLIVVSVALDMVQRIEANLLMRNYGGFLSGGPGRRASGSRADSIEDSGRGSCVAVEERQSTSGRGDSPVWLMQLFTMPIVLKTRREIEMMRRAGRLGCEILAKMREAAVAGVTTGELDELARVELDKVGGDRAVEELPDLQGRRRLSRLHLHQRQRGSRSRHPRQPRAQGRRRRHARPGPVARRLLLRHGHDRRRSGRSARRCRSCWT